MSLLISLYIKITAGAQGERSSSELTVTCVLGVTVSLMMDEQTIKFDLSGYASEARSLKAFVSGFSQYVNVGGLENLII